MIKVLLYRSFVFASFSSKTWCLCVSSFISLYVMISTELMEIAGDFHFRGLSTLYLMSFASSEIADIVSALLILWTLCYFTRDVVMMLLFPFVRQRLCGACNGVQNWKDIALPCNAMPRANGDNYASNSLGVCFGPCLSLNSSVQEIWNVDPVSSEPLEANKALYKMKAFGLHPWLRQIIKSAAHSQVLGCCEKHS